MEIEEKNINLKIVPPREYLPKIAVAVAGVLILFLVVLSVSGVADVINKIKESQYIGQDAQYKNTISVTGEGKVSGKPDIGKVNLSVVSDAKTVAIAQKDNTDKMNKIIQSMKDLGVKEEDLKTTNYSVSPNYQYFEGKSEIIGYQISQTLEVRIRDLEKVGDILTQAATAGANQVGSLYFTFDDSEKLNTEARRKAIANAKVKAQTLAGALGVSLGEVVSFSENSSDQPEPMYYASDSLGKGGGASSPEVQTGQNEINISVDLSYEIY